MMDGQARQWQSETVRRLWEARTAIYNNITSANSYVVPPVLATGGSLSPRGIHTEMQAFDNAMSALSGREDPARFDDAVNAARTLKAALVEMAVAQYEKYYFTRGRTRNQPVFERSLQAYRTSINALKHALPSVPEVRGESPGTAEQAQRLSASLRSFTDEFGLIQQSLGVKGLEATKRRVDEKITRITLANARYVPRAEHADAGIYDASVSESSRELVAAAQGLVSELHPLYEERATRTVPSRTQDTLKKVIDSMSVTAGVERGLPQQAVQPPPTSSLTGSVGPSFTSRERLSSWSAAPLAPPVAGGYPPVASRTANSSWTSQSVSGGAPGGWPPYGSGPMQPLVGPASHPHSSMPHMPSVASSNARSLKELFSLAPPPPPRPSAPAPARYSGALVEARAPGPIKQEVPPVPMSGPHGEFFQRTYGFRTENINTVETEFHPMQVERQFALTADEKNLVPVGPPIYHPGSDPSFTVRGPQEFDEEMDKVFPIRDPKNPAHVHPDYVSSVGNQRCGSRVEVIGVKIHPDTGNTLWADMLNANPALKAEYNAGSNRRQYEAKRRFLANIEAACRSEIESTVKGRAPPSQQVLQAKKLTDNECAETPALIGQYGVVLKEGVSQEQQPSLKNHKIMGLFAGAKLVTSQDEADYVARFGKHFVDHYAADVTDSVTYAPYGGGGTMSACNANFNREGVVSSKGNDARFYRVEFVLRDRNGHERTEPMFMVAMPGIMPPGKRQILLDYGPAHRLTNARGPEPILPIKSESHDAHEWGGTLQAPAMPGSGEAGPSSSTVLERRSSRAMHRSEPRTTGANTGKRRLSHSGRDSPARRGRK